MTETTLSVRTPRKKAEWCYSLWMFGQGGLWLITAIIMLTEVNLYLLAGPSEKSQVFEAYTHTHPAVCVFYFLELSKALLNPGG